jgi:hypothetical protein
MSRGYVARIKRDWDKSIKFETNADPVRKQRNPLFTLTAETTPGNRAKGI